MLPAEYLQITAEGICFLSENFNVAEVKEPPPEISIGSPIIAGLLKKSTEAVSSI